MNNSITDNSEINDIRTQKDFRIFSFSNYKKTEVKNKIVNEMKSGKIENAVYWSSELVCAGHYYELWDIIIFFFSKFIHIGNPKIAVYLERRYEIFKNIINQGFFITELDLRNNQNIRNLFAEIICVLSFSAKKNSFETIKINQIEEFDISQMSDLLKAPEILLNEIFLPKDPKEIFIALNEFAFSISQRDIVTACYWFEWIIEFNNLCISQKKPLFCEKREYGVEKKFKCDIIWLIWDILFSVSICESDQSKTEYIKKLMQSLVYLFCIKYTTASCKKKKYIIYFVIELIVDYDKVPENVEIVSEKETLKMVVEKLNNVYKEIKKNEVSPKTEYLFNGIETKHNSFEKSIEKMEIMNSLGL